MGRHALPGDALDFHQYVLGKPRHFDGRPGRLVVAECLFIDAIYRSKVVHRLEEYLRMLLDTTVALGAGRNGCPYRRLNDFP